MENKFDKIIYLGKENVSSFDDVHDIFKAGLSFPDYYGNNLDAMYDCIKEFGQNSFIIIADEAQLKEICGIKFAAFEKMLEDLVLEEALQIRYFN